MTEPITSLLLRNGLWLHVQLPTLLNMVIIGVIRRHAFTKKNAQI